MEAAGRWTPDRPKDLKCRSKDSGAAVRSVHTREVRVALRVHAVGPGA